MPYYVFDGKAAVGPFDPPALTKMPGFGPTTLVCPVGATTADAWKPASSFPEIAALLAPAAPPPPPPPPSAAPATITLTMPAAPAPAPEPAPAPAPSPAPAAAAPAPQPAPAAEQFAAPKDKLVLVVDDDDGIRDLIEMTASGQGFQVVTAVNGLDAAKKLAERSADLIVTDLMMPGQGGYEFLRSLQAAGGASVPVFVVSASQLDSSTIQMIRQEANVVEFIPKPIRMPAFVAALHKHLKTAPR